MLVDVKYIITSFDSFATNESRELG